MGDCIFMDTNKQHPMLTIASQHQLPQAQLWIGSHNKLVERTHTFLQQRWCSSQGCNKCTICNLITQHQYHSVLWVEPKDKYTREDLESIFQTLQFTADHNREFIFVIQKADYLTPACYNSLLKSIEEPPRGYYFILLAERLKEVAPTIRSRCIIQNFSSEITDIREHALALHFASSIYEPPFQFLQTLEQTDPTEHETRELVDALLAYWISAYKQALQETNTSDIAQATHALQLLEHALEEPPMPGSSKLFWKNLFVQFKH